MCIYTYINVRTSMYIHRHKQICEFHNIHILYTQTHVSARPYKIDIPTSDKYSPKSTSFVSKQQQQQQSKKIKDKNVKISFCYGSKFLPDKI